MEKKSCKTIKNFGVKNVWKKSKNICLKQMGVIKGKIFWCKTSKRFDCKKCKHVGVTKIGGKNAKNRGVKMLKMLV